MFVEPPIPMLWIESLYFLCFTFQVESVNFYIHLCECYSRANTRLCAHLRFSKHVNCFIVLSHCLQNTRIKPWLCMLYAVLTHSHSEQFEFKNWFVYMCESGRFIMCWIRFPIVYNIFMYSKIMPFLCQFFSHETTIIRIFCPKCSCKCTMFIFAGVWQH